MAPGVDSCSDLPSGTLKGTVRKVKKKIIAGNWKMNMDHIEGAALAGGILSLLEQRESTAELVVIPPYTTLPSVAEELKDSDVKLGGQDVYYEVEGAFTGEISGKMLRALGCTYVLVGHSERRHVIGESGGLLSKKLRAALAAELLPIFCVGETLDEREGGRASDIVNKQVGEVLEGLGGGDIGRIVLAYEPVWAIGTGITATPQDASHMHGVIREIMGELFGGSVAEGVRILYGGSVKPSNAADLLGAAGVDGVLVGGASLEAESFMGIAYALEPS